MARMNRAMIGENQSRTLKNRIDSALNGVDLDFRGRHRTSSSSDIVLKGYSANLNRALFWLSCKRDDYVRESLKGGVLYDLLGVIGNENNLKKWEDTIRNRFNDEFRNDLELLDITLTMDRTRKTLMLEMMIRDVIENRVFPASTEVRI